LAGKYDATNRNKRRRRRGRRSRRRRNRNRDRCRNKNKPEIVPLDDIVGRKVRNDGEVDELEFEEASVEDERRKELALPARPTMLRRVIVVHESLQETKVI
jgi:hypothetical protein